MVNVESHPFDSGDDRGIRVGGSAEKITSEDVRREILLATQKGQEGFDDSTIDWFEQGKKGITNELGTPFKSDTSLARAPIQGQERPTTKTFAPKETPRLTSKGKTATEAKIALGASPDSEKPKVYPQLESLLGIYNVPPDEREDMRSSGLGRQIEEAMSKFDKNKGDKYRDVIVPVLKYYAKGLIIQIQIETVSAKIKQNQKRLSAVNALLERVKQGQERLEDPRWKKADGKSEIKRVLPSAPRATLRPPSTPLRSSAEPARLAAERIKAIGTKADPIMKGFQFALDEKKADLAKNDKAVLKASGITGWIWTKLPGQQSKEELTNRGRLIQRDIVSLEKQIADRTPYELDRFQKQLAVQQKALEKNAREIEEASKGFNGWLRKQFGGGEVKKDLERQRERIKNEIVEIKEKIKNAASV